MEGFFDFMGLLCLRSKLSISLINIGAGYKLVLCSDNPIIFFWSYLLLIGPFFKISGKMF